MKKWRKRARRSMVKRNAKSNPFWRPSTVPASELLTFDEMLKEAMKCVWLDWIWYGAPIGGSQPSEEKST